MAEENAAESAASSAGNFLQKEVAGMPVWIWGTAILAGLGLSYYLSTRGDSKIDSTDSAGPKRPKVVEDVSSYPGVGRQASGWNYNPPPPEEDDSEGFANNQEWGRHVIDQMIANGYDPELVDKAVRTYLSNLELNNAEQTIINIILSKYGSPPSLIGPPETDADPDKPVTGEQPEPQPDTGFKPPAPTNPYRPNPNAAGKYPPPTNVRAVAGSPTSVRVTFDEPSPKAQAYRVYHNYSNTNVGVTLDNYIAIGGLYPDTDYEFWVVSIDRKGGWGGARGKPSAPASVHTPPAGQGGQFLGGHTTVPVSGGYREVSVTPFTDSLGLMADKYLGSAQRWPDIYNLNRDRLNNPASVYVGQTLRIPA